MTDEEKPPEEPNPQPESSDPGQPAGQEEAGEETVPPDAAPEAPPADPEEGTPSFQDRLRKLTPSKPVLLGGIGVLILAIGGIWWWIGRDRSPPPPPPKPAAKKEEAPPLLIDFLPPDTLAAFYCPSLPRSAGRLREHPAYRLYRRPELQILGAWLRAQKEHPLLARGQAVVAGKPFVPPLLAKALQHPRLSLERMRETLRGEFLLALVGAEPKKDFTPIPRLLVVADVGAGREGWVRLKTKEMFGWLRAGSTYVKQEERSHAGIPYWVLYDKEVTLAGAVYKGKWFFSNHEETLQKTMLAVDGGRRGGLATAVAFHPVDQYMRTRDADAFGYINVKGILEVLRTYLPEAQREKLEKWSVDSCASASGALRIQGKDFHERVFISMPEGKKGPFSFFDYPAAQIPEAQEMQVPAGAFSWQILRWNPSQAWERVIQLMETTMPGFDRKKLDVFMEVMVARVGFTLEEFLATLGDRMISFNLLPPRGILQMSSATLWSLNDGARFLEYCDRILSSVQLMGVDLQPWLNEENYGPHRVFRIQPKLPNPIDPETGRPTAWWAPFQASQPSFCVAGNILYYASDPATLHRLLDLRDQGKGSDPALAGRFRNELSRLEHLGFSMGVIDLGGVFGWGLDTLLETAGAEAAVSPLGPAVGYLRNLSVSEALSERLGNLRMSLASLPEGYLYEGSGPFPLVSTLAAAIPAAIAARHFQEEQQE
jgi:hypothetical protein